MMLSKNFRHGLSFAIGFGLLWLVSLPVDARIRQRYCNERYGFCLDIPAGLQVDAPPANGDGRRYFDNQGFELRAYGSNNALDTNLTDEMQSASEDFDKITFRKQGKNWFALSGYKGDKILYYKVFAGSGSHNYLHVEYPTAARKKYDALIARIEKSFTPGNLSEGH